MKRLLLTLLFVGGCGGMPVADSGEPSGGQTIPIQDEDADGIADHLDNCPDNYNSDQIDADNDGVGNACDNCMLTPNSDQRDQDLNGLGDACEPIQDQDADGIADNLDGCPHDPSKTEPGICGCAVLETDTDHDGTPDCLDQCPNDPNKTEPGVCGCDVADVDSDFDGTPDCIDECPGDPFKVSFGACGCGAFDDDFDLDGVPDFCLDNCPLAFNPNQLDSNQDGIGDACSVVIVTTELLLFADDGQFLGVVSDNPFDPDSIANSFGTYGSVFRPLSIWNSFGTYGSSFRPLSPWNTFTRTPPLLFEDTGAFVAFITANSLLSPAIHPNDLAIIVGRTDVLR